MKMKDQEAQKQCNKTELKFEDYKNYLQTIQFESEINYQEKDKLEVYSF